MNEYRVLYDLFRKYYEEGIKLYESKKYNQSKRNLILAAQTLLKLAKISEGELKIEKLKRAKEIEEKIKLIEKKIQKESNNDPISDLKKVNNSNDSKSNKENNESSLTKFEKASSTNISLNDVAGLNEAKDEIRRKIIEPELYPELYKKFKKNRGGGILLYGAPGTGKTMFAQAIANDLNAAFYSVRCSDIVSKWFGDSEKNIKSLFEEARKNKYSIIFFDEFEAIGSKRDTNSTVMKRIVPELLAQMQGFESCENTLVIIAATNRPWDIDSAFVRPGRIDTQIYVPLPDDEARMYIIKKNLDSVPLDENFDYKKIVEVTNGFNGSDVVKFCDVLKDFPIEREKNTGINSFINNEDIESTANIVKSSVRKEDIEKMIIYQQTIK